MSLFAIARHIATPSPRASSEMRKPSYEKTIVGEHHRLIAAIEDAKPRPSEPSGRTKKPSLE